MTMLTNVFVKLDASSRTEAVHKARLKDLL